MTTNRAKYQAAWVFGAVSISVLIWIILFGPEQLPPGRHKALGVLCSILCGLFGFFFTGSIKIISSATLPHWGKVSIQAGGGAALFILVLVWWNSNSSPVGLEELHKTSKETKQNTVKIIALLEEELKSKNTQIAFLQTRLTETGKAVPTERAKELAEQIPGDYDDDYALALKAIAEQRFNDAHRLLDGSIAQNAADKGKVASIQIMKAMAYLWAGQFHQAQIAFNAVDIRNLRSVRDQALKRIQEPLLWWFATSTKPTWDVTDFTQAQAALGQLGHEQTRLADAPETRDYIAELRAWIGLSAARNTLAANRARDLVLDTLDVYAQIFTPDDFVAIAEAKPELASSEVIDSVVRRRLRAKPVLDFARRLNKDSDLSAHPKTVTFDHWINS